MIGLNTLADKEELLSRIFQITKENSIYVTLKKNTATLELFDAIKFFNSGEKKFLVFENASYIYTDNRLVWYSFVICSSWMLYYDTPAFSMSYLKSQSRFPTEYGSFERFKDDKIYSLLCCIRDVFPKEPKKGDIIPFKEPCMLKAQTNDDRYGFRNEWGTIGGDNKKYGDAPTPFAIIGIMI